MYKRREELTPEEAYGCREQIFAGLQSMDWIAYGTLGEAGKYFETAEALQIWLAEQETLSKKEILGLQKMCIRDR